MCAVSEELPSNADESSSLAPGVLEPGERSRSRSRSRSPAAVVDGECWDSDRCSAGRGCSCSGRAVCCRWRGARVFRVSSRRSSSMEVRRSSIESILRSLQAGSVTAGAGWMCEEIVEADWGRGHPSTSPRGGGEAQQDLCDIVGDGLLCRDQHPLPLLPGLLAGAGGTAHTVRDSTVGTW